MPAIHHPKGQIDLTLWKVDPWIPLAWHPSINGVLSSIGALFFDDVLQLDYVHTPGWLDSE